MGANPNPKRIAPATWAFWQAFKKAEPKVKLGGIYADKRGYHNFRDDLPANDYSVRRAEDKLGPGDKACAIDLTLPPAEMKKYTKRLMAAAKAKDPRVKHLKEFFGTIDGKTVTGWDIPKHGLTHSDDSHLWHIHISFTRRFVEVASMYADLLSVLLEEPKASPPVVVAKKVVKAPVKAAKAVVHVVKKGDTLSKIAARYKTTLAKVLSLNPKKKKNPDAIDVGERIKVS